MERIILPVPRDIRYISEWKELNSLLPKDTPYIMNKTITGCGYTEYCINNEYPVIICSPRKILLENKEDQHSGDENVLYVKDEYSTFQSFDADLSKDAKTDKTKEKSEKDIEKAKEYTAYLKQKIGDHLFNCSTIYNKPTKYLVTYDSFRRIKEALGDSIDKFTVVVDEFQSLFTDARFKSDTENEFLFQLQGLRNVIYLSATPMMDKYLEQLDSFKDLPYYELDWATENPSRVIKPILKTKQCRSIVEEANRIIGYYKEGKFEKITRQLEDGTFEEVYSKEAVIYVNSVKNICDIIRSCKLTLNETNVLCSDDADNRKKIKDAFKKAGDTSITAKTKCIGKVPKEGEQHKMFTLCTRTVYLGADFYSTCARSFILSDANVECLSVDISLDLPQILGRQRLDENPWKNYAEFYYRLNTKEKTQEEFNEYIQKKIRKTENSLLTYQSSPTLSSKHDLAKDYQFIAKTRRYKVDYVAVNEHGGSDLKPTFNKLVMISEQRAFEIQQVDYADRFSMFNALDKQVETDDINEYINTFYSFSHISEKYKYLCSLPESVVLSIFSHLPSSFQNYYTVLGKNRIIALRYNITDMKREYEGIIGNQGINIRDYITSAFNVNEEYTKAEVKKKLKEIYDSLGYSKTPKAVDLGDYFIISNCRIQNDKTGKRDAGYRIINVKT